MNLLIALLEPGHVGFEKANKWFAESGKDSWAICPLSELGFVRITTSPSFLPSPRTLSEARSILAQLSTRPGYHYWPIAENWNALTAPFADRIFGHQQVTDAYLLGLANKNDGVLVTFDRRISYLAGAKFSQHLLVLD